MKIEFTRTARWQLSLLNEMLSPATGFILGTTLGRIKIFDNLFPLGFNKRNVNRIYHQVYLASGERLLGIFFLNTKIFYHDWFLENLILESSDHGRRVLFYHLDSGDGERRCQTVFEM